MTVEILLDYIGQSKKDPSNVHNFLILNKMYKYQQKETKQKMVLYK